MTIGTTHAADPGLVVVLGRDAAITCEALATGGIRSRTLDDLTPLADALAEDLGAVLLPEEALTPGRCTALATALAGQPAWSDLPVLLLVDDREPLAPALAQRVTALRLAGNITVLTRPLAALTLVTAVQSALRARWRQYEVRDLLASERRARAQAETATRLKDEFLATVSHELRTPLSAILIWSNLIASGRVKPPDMGTALHAIERSAADQSRMIEDLLDVSRILSGKLHVHPREGQLAPIAQAALAVVTPSAQAKSLRLEVELDPAAGAVLADPGRMQQVIWNLLSNAVKFTPAGGRVTLRLERDADQVQIRVSDTGSGIAPEFLPHVFERFRQADASTTRSHGGLGLGLAIARELVELHGGTLSADSPGEGQGAVFTVRLPRVPPGPSAPPEPPPPPPASARPLAGLRVLLVENEPHTREAIGFVLRDAGAELTAVDSTRAALDALFEVPPTARPHLLLSDIGMPGANGHALIHAVRAAEALSDAPPIPAAALTAYTREEDRKRALAMGFQMHLAKPVEPGALIAAVLTLVRDTLGPRP